MFTTDNLNEARILIRSGKINFEKKKIEDINKKINKQI